MRYCIDIHNGTNISAYINAQTEQMSALATLIEDGSWVLSSSTLDLDRVWIGNRRIAWQEALRRSLVLVEKAMKP